MTTALLAESLIDSVELRLKDGRVFTISGPQVESFELEYRGVVMDTREVGRYYFTLKAWSDKSYMSVAPDVSNYLTEGTDNG